MMEKGERAVLDGVSEKVFRFLALRMLEHSFNMFKPHDVIQLVSSLK